MRRPRAMISSTARDLPQHREQVRLACEHAGFDPHDMMEHLPALDADALDASLRMVGEADVYIGVFAQRYGFVPDGRDLFRRAAPPRRVPPQEILLQSGLKQRDAVARRVGAAFAFHPLRTLGERESGTERLIEAVEAFRAALQERTRERVPLHWAMTQNNLGEALRALV